MAYDAFLKLDGIKGESQDAKHKGEIDIMSFSWGAVQTGTSAVGGGAGSGKVSLQDLHITKKVDGASPLLFLNCANGTHIKEANLVVRKAGGDQLEYLKIKLTDILVSSYQPSGHSGGGDDIPTEAVSLNFAKIEMNYQPQGADGKALGGPILAGWDVKANKKV
jgi:type VI secretion system secreted protein Hcp